MRKLTYSVAEAAKALGISERSVRRAVAAGALPVVSRSIAGNRTLIPIDALEAHVAASVQQAAS
jgi:excisionase family DNA binding protein